MDGESRAEIRRTRARRTDAGTYIVDAQNTKRATQHQQPVSSVPRWPCCQASSAPGRARSRAPLSSPRLSPARWPLSTRLPRAPSRSLARGSMLPVRPAGSRSTRSSPVTGESLFVNPVVSPPSSALYGHTLLDRRVFLTPFSPFFPPAAFPRSTLVVGPGVLFSTTQLHPEAHQQRPRLHRGQDG